MKVFVTSSVVGCIYAVGLMFVAVKYPGPIPWLPAPEKHTAEVIMDALAPVATTTEESTITSRAFVSPEGVIDTALGNQPATDHEYKEQEIVSEIFAAMARADKERFGMLYSIDFERIYDPRVFENRAEIERWMQLFEGAQKETEADLEQYYELRIKYAQETLKRYGASEQSQTNFLKGLQDGAKASRQYNIQYLAALETHLQDLYTWYAFMLSHQGEYEVINDGGEYYVLFDTDSLSDEYAALTQPLAESGASVDKAYTVLVEVTNASLKQAGLDLNAEEMFEKMVEKYY